MIFGTESQAVLNDWLTRSSNELEFSPPCPSTTSTVCLCNVMIKKIAQMSQVGTTDGYQCHTAMGAGGGSCGTQLCQVNWGGDLMPEKCHTMDSFGSFPSAQLINLNTKACKVMQIYFSNSKRAAKGFETLLFFGFCLCLEENAHIPFLRAL